jgi:hypothetical protein
VSTAKKNKCCGHPLSICTARILLPCTTATAGQNCHTIISFPPPLSRYTAAFAVAQAQEGPESSVLLPVPGINLGSQPETHTKRQATQHGCLSRFTEARTETDKIKDDSKIKRETNLDGHGLRPIPNVCHLPDPPWFSSQTTLNGRFLIFDFSTFVQKVFVDVNRWLIAIVCQADYGLNFSIIKAYIRNFSLQ